MILEELVMKKSYGVNELRRMYLDFFKSKGHLVMKSFSLVHTMTTAYYSSMREWHRSSRILQDRRFRHADV